MTILKKSTIRQQAQIYVSPSVYSSSVILRRRGNLWGHNSLPAGKLPENGEKVHSYLYLSIYLIYI